MFSNYFFPGKEPGNFHWLFYEELYPHQITKQNKIQIFKKCEQKKSYTNAIEQPGIIRIEGYVKATHTLTHRRQAMKTTNNFCFFLCWEKNTSSILGVCQFWDVYKGLSFLGDPVLFEVYLLLMFFSVIAFQKIGLDLKWNFPFF